MWQDPTGGERGMLAVGRVNPSAVCYPRLMNLSERQTIPLLVLCGLLAIVVFAIDLNLPILMAMAERLPFLDQHASVRRRPQDRDVLSGSHLFDSQLRRAAGRESVCHKV